MASPHQFALFRQRRFAPLFWTQFLGAANDNVFKFSFTLLATYFAERWGGVNPTIASFLIAGLFIAPFVFFSATSGQLADKYEKGALIRRIKELEIAIMVLAAIGFAMHMAWVLYFCVFLMGLHSTLFGPVKYAYLPQHLDTAELTGGNGLVEMGTFVAILLGTIAGGVLVSLGEHAALVVGTVVIVIAMAGRVAAHFIPRSPSADPQLRIRWNPLTETIQNVRLATRQRALFNSLLGISWLWFFGSIFLTSFTPFARDNLGGNANVVTFLLAVFSIGIGVGSVMCERLSNARVEIGLVPFGSIGMTVFAIDVYFASRGFTPLQGEGVSAFLAAPGGLRITLDLALLALFAGLYSVPLYALIQSRSEPSHAARIIAANNILNAVFMVIAALLAAALLKAGLSIPQLFLVVGLMNVVVAAYIYALVPEFLLRFLAWLLAHTLYRVQATGRERIPHHGPAVLVCNHVSFVDPIVIMGESPRPVRFVMDHRIFKIPLLNWFFKQTGAIAIAPAKEDPKMLEEAWRRIDAALAEGELVCIFPEGRITDHGDLYPFRPGIAHIVGRTPVLVIPMALKGLWGSFFSRYGGTAFSRPIGARLQRGWRSRLEFVVGEPVDPQDATPDFLQERVAALRGSVK
ncbi:MAG TPA: MFS transporter [Burkholderiaceae bacterium]|nr:MFS transporter [Burkholderiaceae bacterium]